MAENESKYPYRAPRKYPKKDLHGRPRFGNLSYQEFKRFQKFWVDLFGWDMFELPEAAGGKKPGCDTPSVLIATGPSYETWEGVVPGHMNMMGRHVENDSEIGKATFMMEIHMDEPVTMTADNVIKHGGSVVGEIPEEKEGWSTSLTISDPNGNVWGLWRCPSSRTWDEAEAGYDKD